MFLVTMSAGADHLQLCSTEPWCAVPSSGLQLGPAHSLVGTEAQEEQACSAVSLAISLLSGSATYSSSGPSSTGSTNQQHSSSKAGHNSTMSIPTGSTHYSLEQLADPHAGADLLSPAPAPARPVAASERIKGWSAVASNPVVKRLKLTSTASQSCSSDVRMEDEVMIPPASPLRAAVLQAVCPAAPKRPRPALLRVPLAELGRMEATA
jgi:hypothetical protein